VALFLSRFDNKVDRKGRVSVPAPFRAVLANQAFQGIVAYPSPVLGAVEACSMDRFEQLAEGIDNGFNQFTDEHGALATVLLSKSHPLQFDSEGRVMLTDALMQHAGITDMATFAGRGKTFQIWNPASYDIYEREATEKAREAAVHLETARRQGVEAS
jgi:MraZ protein